MATLQQLLNDIDLRYRNSFTVAQKLVWMNEEQQELFQIFQFDSAPYAFQLVQGVRFYPIPDEVDIDRIKVITVQVNDGNPPQFRQLDFRRNDDDVEAWINRPWYTIVEKNFYIHLPTETMYEDNRVVYVYHDSPPATITTSDLNKEPSVPVRYQEILKLGVLERIAAARKDVQMKNNYAADKQEKILEMEWRMKMSEPEFVSPTDVNPRIRNHHYHMRRPIYITITTTE